MAEGGLPHDDEGNPFSIHNFLQSRPESASKQEGDFVNTERDETASLNVTGSPIAMRESEATPIDQVTKREENPFSFRQFLKKESTGKPRHNTIPRSGDLPDFVQGHFVADHQPHSGSPPALTRSDGDGSDLPEPSLAGGHQVADGGSGRSDRGPRSAERYRVKPDSSVKPKSSRRSATGSGVPTSGALPDFLSDGPMSEKAERRTDSAGTARVTAEQEQSKLFKELKEENGRLKRHLDRIQASLIAESQKVQDLERQVETLRKKEADETQALENIVENVENNLQGAAERAVIAETTIMRLKQEEKLLRSQMMSLSKENEMLRSIDHSAKDMKRKAEVTSNQIAAAAATAEQQLKQLLNGVSSLKMLAACLKNIDQLSEEDQNFSEKET